METKRKLLDEISLETFARDNNLRLIVAEGVIPAQREDGKSRVYFSAYFESKGDDMWVKTDSDNYGKGQTEDEAIKHLIESLSGQRLEIELYVPKLKREENQK